MSGIATIAGIPSATQSAVGAIKRAVKSLDKDAATIANPAAFESSEPADTVGALVDSRQQVLYTQAAAKIINASDEMLQSLIDIRA